MVVHGVKEIASAQQTSVRTPSSFVRMCGHDDIQSYSYLRFQWYEILNNTPMFQLFP